ncbi:MAG: 16S rRNA (cytosine(967)-C(5))-methyltransferase RsmB [Acidobacteriota bacterium]
MSASISPSRQAAFDILWRVANEDAYAGSLLASGRYTRLSREDHALSQELVLGTLRWQLHLDFLIEHFARRKLNKLDPEVVIALRLGLYQLRFLSRVPPHAAINESVNLVKERKKQSAAPLVNAVLRSAQRDSQSSFSQTIKDPLVRLSVETSHPAWLLRRWRERLGEPEAREMALANNASPRAAFRFNRRRQSEEKTRDWLVKHNIEIADSALTPQAFVITSGSLSAQSEAIREGWLYVQDEASQLIAHLAGGNLKPQPSNLKTLDFCAAPGSKTGLLASLLSPDAVVVAGDLYLHRLRTMKELNARLGLDRINLVQLDATKESPFEPESFDLVLLDAPCSGLGTLQRHPEIKWRMTEEKIPELAELQKRLLSNAARQLRAGGLLVYSVCSTEPEEGEQIIEWFRGENSGYRDMTRERLAELGIDPSPLLTATHGARTFTHRQEAESFFFCVLWKRR